MKKMSLFQQIERQAEKDAKKWKRKRIEELIAELGESEAEISPPQRGEIDKEKKDNN